MASAGNFDEAFHDLHAIAYKVAFRVLGSRQDAEDVAQEALVRACVAWRRAGTYPEAWTAKVAGGLAIDIWRRRHRRPDEPVPPAHDAFGAVDERLRLNAALGALSRRQREVVTLRFLADLPEATVAATLGCSVGAVKQHAARGLAALRSSLEHAGVEVS